MELKLYFNRVDEAIAVMREVAAWGRAQGLRLWREEWLTREELLTDDAQPENFCIGLTKEGETACAFILQERDSEYWPEAREGEAVYLHKLCVRRAFAHRQMSRAVIEEIKRHMVSQADLWNKKNCQNTKVRYIRLDTALDEEKVSRIYLDMGFQIVKTIDCGNGRAMALYELEVT